MTVHYQHTPRTFDKGSDKGTPLIKQIRALLFGRASSLAQPLKEHHYHSRTFVRDVWSDSGVVSIIWILLWAFVLWWGERAVFDSKVGNCAWNRWEQWPQTANPHHVVLLADPQLVDPHTYPGRPWPLSTLTVRYTDLYLRKSFEQLQQTLDPDTLLFLGDLFDGGREWTTHPSASQETESVEKRWRKYGDAFWLKEYYRFSRIFFNTWLRGRNDGRRDRKIIASLPGNHDLGLGIGIRPPVRQRFNTYFGSGNRVDFIGNHTIVSLDTVSLSAKGQPNVGQGAASIPHSAEEIWAPTEDFLSDVKATKRRLIQQQLRLQAGNPENELHLHKVLDVPPPLPTQTPKPAPQNFDIPSIVLTHVPLFRAAGTPCGPLRERYPPSTSGEGGSTEKDDRNAISVTSGVQYQNVLTPEITKQVIDQVGDVEHVFSGDDHDYCEVVHRGYTGRSGGGGGGIREITVKSMSWAMGVRKPGFLLLSLWNPVDAEGKSLKTPGDLSPSTMQTHLCLLPDQLGIFLRYGYLFAVTITLLFIRAARNVYSGAHRNRPKTPNGNLLPVSKLDGATSDEAIHAQHHPEKASSIEKSSHRGLASRSTAATRTSRSSSPFNGYALPVGGRSRAASMQQRLLTSTNGTVSDDGGKIAKDRFSFYSSGGNGDRKRGVGGMMGMVLEQTGRGLLPIAAVVIPWYLWLLWSS